MSTRKRARVESDDAEDVRNEPDSSASQHAKFSDNAQEEQTQERQRDTEFWFEDGSVLLVAGGFEFKVYRAVLSARSLVFKDMFSLPQPPAAPTPCRNQMSCSAPPGLRRRPSLHA